MRAAVVGFVSRTVLAGVLAAPISLCAQPLTGGSIAPYAGYVITGNLFDGPVGTSVTAANAPLVGIQLGVPVVSGVSLTGSAAYASGDLRIGLPILGGVNVGTAKRWLYDAALELGGLTGKQGVGIAPFLQGGIGGITSDITNRLLDTRSTNLAYIAGVGVDAGIKRGFAIRLQARDYIGRFDSREAVGIKVEGNLAHTWALSAGVKLAF